DPHDIFNDEYDAWKFRNCLIGYKQSGEYGTFITLFNNFGDKYLSALYCGGKFTLLEILEKGLKEQIYSNRTEYYINGTFYSNSLNHSIEDLVNKINVLFLENKVSELFYNFVVSDDEFIILPNYEFDDVNINFLYCDRCNTMDNINNCDFCDIKICDKCCPDE